MKIFTYMFSSSHFRFVKSRSVTLHCCRLCNNTSAFLMSFTRKSYDFSKFINIIVFLVHLYSFEVKASKQFSTYLYIVISKFYVVAYEIMICNTSLSYRQLMIVTLKQFTMSVLVLLKLNIYFFSSSKVCRTLNQHAYNNVSCGKRYLTVVFRLFYYPYYLHYTYILIIICILIVQVYRWLVVVCLLFV